MEDKRKALYDALSGEYDLGSYEDFTTKLNDENKRRALYDAAGQDYNLGSYEEYSEKLGFGSEPSGIVPMFNDEPQGAPMPENVEENSRKLRGLWANFKESSKGLWAGLKGYAGEQLNLFTGSSREEQAALNDIEQLEEQGVDVMQYLADKEDAEFHKSYGMSKDQFLALDKKERKRLVRQASERMLEQQSVMSDAQLKELKRRQTNQQIVEDAFNNALEIAGGDLTRAKEILREQAADKTKGDILIEEATETMNNLRQPEGFAGWVGNMLPQMVPAAASIAINYLTKGKASGLSKALGYGTMGGLTLSTAGMSMIEARNAGATNLEVWATGIADGAIEIISEKIPFDRVTKRVFSSAKANVAEKLGDAVLTPKGRKELEKLLSDANEKLGGKLFSKKNIGEWLTDTAYEAAGEFTAEALQTITTMIYENPEDYPTISDVLANGWEGAKAGLFMGSITGGASLAASHAMNKDRRQTQGYVDVAQMENENGDVEVVEVVGEDPQTGNVTILHGDTVEEISQDKLGDRFRFSYEEFENGRLRSREDDAIDNGVVNDGQIRGMEETIQKDLNELRNFFTEDEINQIASGTIPSEASAEGVAAARKYMDDVQRIDDLHAAKAEQDQKRKAAVRDRIESEVGQRFWVQEEGEDDGSGIIPVAETVEEVVYSDGRVGYVVGSDEAGNLTMVYNDGSRGFSSRAEIAEKENSGEILSNTVMGLDDYLAIKVDIEDVAAETTRMEQEQTANVQSVKASHPVGSVINVGTAEAKVEVPVIATTADGVIVQMPDGTTPQLTWADVAHAEGQEVKPKTNAELDQEIVDEYRVAYQPAVKTGQEPSITEREIEVEQTTPANPLPLKADGSVDQTALWNKDPERWAQWNDEQRQDGGANSLAYVSGAIAKEQAKIAELQAAYNAEADFDKRDAIEKEIADTQERVGRLTAIQQGYVAQAEAAAPVAETQPESTLTARMASEMTQQELNDLDESYDIILSQTRVPEEKARLLQEYLDKIAEGSTPIKVLTRDNYEDVMRAAGCPEEDIIAVGRVMKRLKPGRAIAGFVSAESIFVMADGIPSISEARVTYVHERQHVINSSKADKVREMAIALGDKANALAVLEKFVGVDGLAEYENDPLLKLADEIIARCMEIAYTTEEFSVDLQSKGLSDSVISIIEEIDNEQRNDKSLIAARRSAYAGISRRTNAAQDGRNSGQVSGGILVGEENRSAGVGGQGTGAGSTGEGAEVISEEQLNAPNSGTAQQITAADGEVLADTDGKGGVRFSIRTWNEGGRDYLAAWLANDAVLTEEEKADILARMDEFYKNALLYSDTYVPFGTWSDAEVRYDNEGNPLMSVVKANGDYAMNLDFSLVCKKRRPLNRLLRTLINRNAFGSYDLKEREIAEINWILQEHGFEVACALCFVDSKRYRVAGVADVFAKLWNNLVTSLAPNGVQIAHFNYNDNPNVEPVENGLDTLPDDQLNWTKLDKAIAKFKKGSVEYKVAQYLREHPEARKLVDATDFIEAEGFEAVKEANPDLLKFYNMKKGTGGPKASFGDVQYLNDILKSGKKFDAEKAYAVGGVRLQSFSDFVPHMYFDYMQLFAELAAKRLPIHAYTKEVLFAKIFGLTGAKINLSLVPAVVEGGIAPGLDAEGNYAWADPVVDAEGNVIQQGQTFPYDEAMAIQRAEGYSKNCGAIAVGISDAHIEKMLDDPNIPFIIPYHKSSLNAIVARMTNINQYKDYTKVQNTRKAGGSKLDKGTKDFNFNEYLHGLGESGTPQMAAQAYLDWCKENKFIPKFSQFAYHPNYYKLLQDFNTIDLTTGEYAPQGAVTMTFPTEESAFGNVETLIQQGLQEDAALEEKMEQEIDGIADQVVARLEEIAKEPKMSDKQRVKKMAELADERMAKIKEQSGVIDLVEEAKKAVAREEAKGNVSFRITPEMKEIKKQAEKDGTFMKAPNGQPTNLTEEQWLMVRTQNFKNWFGDWENDPENASKVVDENGEPKVVFHQTNQKIYVNRETGEIWDELGWKEKMEWDERDDWEDYWEEQDFNTFSRVNARTTNEFDGFFFAPEYDEYHEYGDRTIAAFVNIKNPASREDYNIESRYNDAGRDERIRLQEAGFDGVIRMDGDNVDEYIAFEPNQIKSATDNNGDFNPNNNDIRFRVTPEQDKAYMDAVEAGDMETAQRMVLEAAKLAMPNTKVMDKKGTPTVVYHGTKGKFNTFAYSREDIGFHFGTKGTARTRIGRGKDARIMQVFLNLESPLIFDTDLGSWDADYIVKDLLKKEMMSYDDAKAILLTPNGYKRNSVSALVELRQWMSNNGYDGIIYPNWYESDGKDSYIAFNRNQIKSADPVTYDGAGNVIPLSERFNPENADIRFRTVYHGTAAKFKKFDHAHMGEGEGAQAYGWGTYVTEVPGIGNTYAKAMRDKLVTDTQRENAIVNKLAADVLNAANGNRQEALNYLYGLLQESWSDKKRVKKEIKIITTGRNLPEGKAKAYLYTVDIPDNGIYIQYDQRMDSQAEILNSVIPALEKDGWQKSNNILKKGDKKMVINPKATGGDFYTELSVGLGSDMNASKFLNSVGITGISYPSQYRTGGREDEKRNFVIFNEEDLEIVESVSFRISNNNQASFVSNAAKAVEGIKMEKATPEQWLKMIEKNGGLKAGEDKWMGLSDWLKESDKKTLTKQEVLDFINENMIQIEEVHYAAGAEDDAENTYAMIERILQEKFGKYIAEYYEQNSGEDDDLYGGDSYEYAMDKLREEMNDKFPYTIERSNSVVYLTFPYEETDDLQEWADKLGIKFVPQNPINSTRLDYTTDGLNNKHEIALTVPTIESWNDRDEVHFGDAGDGRAVAWIRFGDTWEQRPSPQISRKVLVIDEIQSKRHQEGREKGYKSKDYWPLRISYLEKKTVYESLYDEMAAKYGEEFTDAPNEEFAKRVLDAEDYERIMKAKTDFDAAADAYIPMRNAIPDAPFDKNWHELAMKRMLRYAAENGYDVIAWTTGDQQAERYNIGSYVSSIEMQEEYDGNRDFGFYMGDSDEATTVTVDENGIVVSAEGHLSQAEGRPLADLVGKDMAVKMMQMEEYDVLEDTDLKVGNEGMKGFYDRMLPAFMNKYGKKWGVKVEDIELRGLENGLTMHSVPVTEEMKASVMEGQVMFRVRQEDETPMEFEQSVLDDFKKEFRLPTSTTVVDINDRDALAAALGYTPEEFTDEMYNDILAGYEQGGFAFYERDTKRIAIFAREVLRNGIMVNNIIFHENTHYLEDENPEILELGEWLWQNSEPELRRKIKEVILESGMYEGEEAYEMLAAYTGYVMSQGKADVAYEKTPSELQKHWELIFNAFGYEPRGKEIRRRGTGDNSGRVGTLRDRRDAEAEMPTQQSDIQDLTAEERRIIGEYFPEFNKSEEEVMKAPNGKDSKLTKDQWNLVRSEEFIDWFGDWINDPENASKVVDPETGEPMLVYHGTISNRFSEFNDEVRKNTKAPKGTYWFVDSEENAMTYAADKEGLYQCFLNLRNPAVIDVEGGAWYELPADYEVYDGEDVDEMFDTLDEAVAFAREHNIDESDIEPRGVTDTNAFVKRIKDKGRYDGAIIKNVIDAGDMAEDYSAEPATEYIVFAPDQIRFRTVNEKITSLDEKPSDLSSEDQDRNNKDNGTEENVRYRVVSDQETLDRLNSEPTIKVYRAMQLIDGKLYPPMSAKVDGELRQPIELGQWEEAEERPDLVDEKGRFKLDKGNKSSLKARYNPYFHTSPTPLNDQFSSAQTRPELVTVEVEVPESELTSGYKAEKAKDSVGKMEWKAGVIQSKLSGTRTVILSRWDKPVRIVPDSEVADVIVDMFEGRDITMPSNVVTPSLRAELEKRGVPFVETDNQGNPVEEVSFRVTGTPTDEVLTNGLQLTPAQTAEVAANIFAALPEEIRKRITDGLNGNVLGLKDAILQIPTSLASKENWNDEDRAMADVVAEEMTKIAGEMTRPFSAEEGLWLLYNNLNKGTDLISQASRALVQRNLGFDAETLAKQEQAKEDVRFRTVGDATSNAQASLYNRGAVNVWTRLKESFVDMQASVEELVKAIEKKTGKAAQGFENILLALNQQSSKGLAAMESYTQKFLNPMFDEIRRIMDETKMKYEDVVRYVILKHGLERNKKLAQRDARAHYQEIYDDIISKITGMTAAQKRTYLTNAQLKEGDAKAELATLQAVDMSAMTDEEKREHKKKLAAARKAVEEAEEHLKRAQKIASLSEQEAQDELDKIFEKIENGTDSVYKEMRENDYSGISSMFYDQLGVDRKKFSTEEQYQAALMEAKKDRYSSLANVEAAAEAEVASFEGKTDTKELWKRINAATKETLRQQYEANMISKDQYDSLRNMFEYYVPLRGFKDNTAEDMYTYYRKPNSTGYTKPILGAEGRKTEAESPFGWIAAMAGSAIASNVKNEAKLALYYFVSNRPENGIATISRTWFVDSGEVDERGKKIFKPAYPPFSEDLSSDAAKASYEAWQENMRELQKKGQAYEAGQRLNLGNAVVNISDANKPEHIVNVKVGGKDYTIIINGNPRAAQAINGDLNIEGTAQDYSALFGPVLRWMSSVNTSYNPEFWITNMMRDMAFTMMAVNIKEDPAYRRKFSKNYRKAFKVISLAAKNENGTIGDSYLEEQYKDFVKYGGVTGYTQIKDSETWEKEIENYLSSNDPESVKNGKVMRGMKSAFHAAHRFGESLEQVSRFAAFLTARETGKSINEAINDAKEITVNFNRKGSGKMITLEEAKYLTGKNGQPLSKFQQWMVVGLSSIAPLGRRFIMFFNAAIQGLNATYKLMKKNPKRFTGWALGYAAVGMMNAVLHAMMDDDDDYLDIPQYERRNSLMIGGNGAYFKWALPQEARAFYALGDLAGETGMGRNPHQNFLGEALKIGTEILPVNPSEGWKAFMPSVAIPAIELMLNEDYKGAPIYNEQKWLSKEERERTAKWSKAYQGTGWAYVKISQGLNFISGGDKHNAGLINLQPEKLEHLVQSAFGGTIRTADKFISTIAAAVDPEEPVTIRQTPFLNRFLTINDERFKNVHVNDVFDYYKADAEHALTLEKQYTKDRDMDALTKLRSSDEYRWAKIYGKYKKPLKALQDKIKVADGTAEKKELMKQQDELKKRMIKEISEL